MLLDICTTYHGAPADVRAARHLVAERLAGIVPGRTCELAVLLTSEVVTNAVLHARGAFVLRLAVRADAVRIEVRDGSARIPAPRPRTLTQEHGRGLYLVVSFASRWGWEPNGEGKCVWFELSRDPGSLIDGEPARQDVPRDVPHRAMGAPRDPSHQLERVAHLQTETLGEHSFGLFYEHAGIERVLQLPR